jgi:2-amino-4-hydroxy-6-hydroxymethyldihydropteridine diphosphokinase
MTKVALGLGTNKGDRLFNIRRAVAIIAERVGSVLVRSDVFETPPWGVHAQPRFLNACILAGVELPPQELLAKIKEIERDMGRQKNGRWGPREIDVDILLYNDMRAVKDPNLSIPHPHMRERAFVLLPLAEIAPGWIHPTSGLSVSELLKRIDSGGILRIARL